MTKYADKSTEELASAFIVSTCQLLPKSFPLLSDHMHDLLPSSDTGVKAYAILCGSHAEFYIRPVNTCIEDVDFLISTADTLAFSGDFPVLPSDISGLHDAIKCYRIERYDICPGFVRLRDIGKLIYNWKYKKYEYNDTALTYKCLTQNLDSFASNFCYLTNDRREALPKICGPAIKHERNICSPYGHLAARDDVESVGCPQWPKEAQAWLKRPRNNGWPTVDKISEVVQNGCHVVYVQHRSCRDDGEQWRFSFSLAEVILIRSWTQVQQIVYHLLRFFAKRKLIKKDCPKEDEVLCPYHLKTLMLWNCEAMSAEWWNSSSVIAICCEMLKKLAEWLKKGHFPNYFIPEANLFHEPSSSTILDKTEGRLNEFSNSGFLCHWFIENYIQPFIQRHLRLKSSMDVMPHFADYILPVLNSWKLSELESLNLLILSTFANSHEKCRLIINRGLSSGLRHCLKIGYHQRCLVHVEDGTRLDLPTIQNVLCFTYFDNLLLILQIAYGLECGDISWHSSLLVEFANAISMQPKIVRSQYHNFPKAYTVQSSRFQFLCAQDIMQNLTGSNSRPEFQLLSFVSKEFLRKALENDGSTSNDIASAASIYLAALHFAASEYQQAIYLCLTVLADHTPQNDKETLNAGCLLFIDDIARIVGLCVLDKKITENNLHYINRRIYLDLRLSPEVFAYYLTVLSADRISKHLDFDHAFPDSAFPMDEYFKALLKPKCTVSMKSNSHFNTVRQIVYRRPDSLTETGAAIANPLIFKKTVGLIGVLMEYALENMTSFYSVIQKDFGIQCNTTDCYRALYFYKCRQYDQVMHLCERILHEPDLQSDLKEFSVANVLLLPPLDSFFDGDVQSLLGFHTLFYYLSPLNDDMAKVGLTPESSFEHWFAQCAYYYGRGLLLSLYYHYPVKCHYFLGRHFLARYLKVRCCMDCNLPYNAALTDFAARETILPFERIIWRFLLQKVRILQK